MKIPSSVPLAIASFQVDSSTPELAAPCAPALVELEPDAFTGIDFHQRYSVYHVLAPKGKDLAKGRADHKKRGQDKILEKMFH